MSFSASGIIEGLGNAAVVIEQAMQKVVADAYEQGYRAGANAVKQAVMASLEGVGTTDNTQPTAVVGHLKRSPRMNIKREPGEGVVRGAISGAVDKALEASNGLPLAKIVERVQAMGVKASREGVGMHLRRNMGTKYRQDGRVWFPLGDKPEAETAGASHQDETPAAA